MEGSWFVFKSFCNNIFTNFLEKIGGGEENRKEPRYFLFSPHNIFFWKNEIIELKRLNTKLERMAVWYSDTNFVHANFPYEVTQSC